jgi:hypothetical protein
MAALRAPIMRCATIGHTASDAHACQSRAAMLSIAAAAPVIAFPAVAVAALSEQMLGAALSRSPGIATFWTISGQLPDMQIIDFARVSRRRPSAVDR